MLNGDVTRYDYAAVADRVVVTVVLSTVAAAVALAVVVASNVELADAFAAAASCLLLLLMLSLPGAAAAIIVSENLLLPLARLPPLTFPTAGSSHPVLTPRSPRPLVASVVRSRESLC